MNCYSSENNGQPADDHSYASYGSDLAEPGVLCQGLVVQRATKHPHARYQESASLCRRETHKKLS